MEIAEPRALEDLGGDIGTIFVESRINNLYEIGVQRFLQASSDAGELAFVVIYDGFVRRREEPADGDLLFFLIILGFIGPT